MIRKYHNHKLQTNPWHRKEEPHNNHETPGRQTKQSNQLSLPHQDECKTRRDIKLCTTKHRSVTDSRNESNNKQEVSSANSVFKSFFRHLKRGIQDFHVNYVLVPADKAANTVVVV